MTCSVDRHSIQNCKCCESNSEKRGHLKNFRNVDCVLANHNKVQDMQANLKTTNQLPLLFRYQVPHWLICHNTITFHEYFWCSQFCEFHSNSVLKVEKN